jgi:hypothetical protein
VDGLATQNAAYTAYRAPRQNPSDSQVLTGGTVTRFILKQYSATERQHTTPPSARGGRERSAAFFTSSAVVGVGVELPGERDGEESAVAGSANKGGAMDGIDGPAGMAVELEMAGATFSSKVAWPLPLPLPLLLPLAG